jgi:hypothetical protein
MVLRPGAADGAPPGAKERGDSCHGGLVLGVGEAGRPVDEGEDYLDGELACWGAPEDAVPTARRIRRCSSEAMAARRRRCAMVGSRGARPGRAPWGSAAFRETRMQSHYPQRGWLDRATPGLPASSGLVPDHGRRCPQYQPSVDPHWRGGRWTRPPFSFRPEGVQ